jgi:hypothetical protein
MNLWLAAAIARMPALSVPLWVAAIGSTANRLVAMQFATRLTCLSGFVFSFASDQPPICSSHSDCCLCQAAC